MKSNFGLIISISIFWYSSAILSNAGPQWSNPTLSLGSLNLAGGLNQSFELGTLTGSPEFAFQIFLEHSIRAEEAISDYKIQQLESYVAPEGRDQIAWLEPGGIRHLFKISEVLDKIPSSQEEPWVAIRHDSGDYDFQSDDGWRYHYSAGAIVSLTAPSGRVLKFETDGLRIRRIYQEIEGKSIDLLIATENEQAQITNIRIGLKSHDFQYSKDTDQLVLWHSNQMSQNVEFAYTSSGLITNVKLANGASLNYTWIGRDQASKNDLGLEVPENSSQIFLATDQDYKYLYGISKAGINLVRQDSQGAREALILNPKTQQLIRKSPDGGEITKFYGLRGATLNRLESIRDAQGRETVRLTYDTKGRVIERKEPGAVPFHYQYDELGRLVKILRLQEIFKSYVYDGNSKKPTKIIDALGQIIEIDYRLDGLVKSVKDLDGNVTEYEYDSLGQVTEIKIPLGYNKKIAYDQFGRIVHIKKFNGNETKYSYDDGDRIIEVNSYDGANWRYEYDPSGQLNELLKDGVTWQKYERKKVESTGYTVIQAKNQYGDVSVSQVNSKGDLILQVDPNGNRTEYKNDAMGRLTGWKDQRGYTSDLKRDQLGRILAASTGEDSKIEMAYDLTGKIRNKKNHDQDTIYSYDKDGRVIKVNYGKGETIDYVYDCYGRIASATTGQGVKTTYEWDALDRKIIERNDVPNIGYTIVKWAYTPSGKTRSVVVYRNSEVVSDQETGYEYDALGRYKKIVVNGVDKVWYHYDNSTMNLMEKIFFDGSLVKFSYNIHELPAEILSFDAKGVLVKNVKYNWNSSGRLSERVIDGNYERYSYDSLGRLTEVSSNK